jgi:hypothetical protein
MVKNDKKCQKMEKIGFFNKIYILKGDGGKLYKIVIVDKLGRDKLKVRSDKFINDQYQMIKRKQFQEVHSQKIIKQETKSISTKRQFQAIQLKHDPFHF